MNLSYKLNPNSLLKDISIFVIIPFSTQSTICVDYSHPDFSEWYCYGADNASIELTRQQKLITPINVSLLKQLLDKDSETYEEDKIKNNPFKRGLIYGINYANNSLNEIKLDILITQHSDGIGTIVLMNTIHSTQVDSFLRLSNILNNWEKLSIINNKTNSLYDYILQLFIKKDHNSICRTDVILGDSYPFFALGDTDTNTSSLHQFINNNKSFIYGVTHQDINFGGWERIREENLDELLDRDLSRRKEYALFLSDVAMLEIDTKTRYNFTIDWAEKCNTTVDNMRIKLLFERVQLLELLLTQRFILQDIESNIQRYSLSSKTPIRRLVSIKNRIIDALSNYYYASYLASQHVSGNEWISYGQHRFHLDELMNHINDHMNLIETSQQIRIDYNSIKGNYIFQLISIVLGSTVVISAIDDLTKLPILSQSWFVENVLWIKIIVYSLFLLVVIILGIRYSKDR